MARAGADMRRFWDERASEDALYFVDNRLPYGDPDVEAFWADGPGALEALLSAVDAPAIRPGDEVVEIGCGVGRMTRALAARGARVRAVDVSERMLELAREYSPELEGVEWILGDGRSLAPLEDESADVCISLIVFQHIPDPEITLGYVAEMGRVLRPGGWAAFQVSDAPEIHAAWSRRRRLGHWVRSLLGRGPRGLAHPAWRGSAVDVERLRAVAMEAGMDVERCVNERTQFCVVLLRRRAQAPATASA